MEIHGAVFQLIGQLVYIYIYIYIYIDIYIRMHKFCHMKHQLNKQNEHKDFKRRPDARKAVGTESKDYKEEGSMCFVVWSLMIHSPIKYAHSWLTEQVREHIEEVDAVHGDHIWISSPACLVCRNPD